MEGREGNNAINLYLYLYYITAGLVIMNLHKEYTVTSIHIILTGYSITSLTK